MKTSNVIDLNPVELGAPKTARSVLKDKLGLSASLPEVLGAVAVSIGVLAAAGFGIGAAINYGQDSTAKGILESVKSAQVLHQSKDANALFAPDLDTLLDAAATGGTAALTGEPSQKHKLTAIDGGRDYCMTIESGGLSHALFYIKGSEGTVKGYNAASLPAGCTAPAPVTP